MNFVLTDRQSPNSTHSNIHDILNECTRFHVMNLICDMIHRSIPIMSKLQWYKIIWQQAWTMEDTYWKSTNVIAKENDLLCKTIAKTNYLTCWFFLDRNPEHMKMCGIMARLVCNASRLKVDAIRLKVLAPSYCRCSNFDHNVVEDSKHILMRCSLDQAEMSKMFDEILNKCPNASSVLKSEPSNTLYWILGKEVPGVLVDKAHDIWIITGLTISKIYKKVLCYWLIWRGF